MRVLAKESPDGKEHWYCDGCGKEVDITHKGWDCSTLEVNAYGDFVICNDVCLPKLRELLAAVPKDSYEYCYIAGE